MSGRERIERVWRWRGGRKGGGGMRMLEVNRLYISQTPFQIYIFRHLPEERKQSNVLKERCFFNGFNFLSCNVLQYLMCAHLFCPSI